MVNLYQTFVVQAELRGSQVKNRKVCQAIPASFGSGIGDRVEIASMFQTPPYVSPFIESEEQFR